MIRRATLADADAVLHCLRTAFVPFRDLYSPEAFADTTLTPETVGQRFAAMQVFVLELTGAGVVGTIACAVHDEAGQNAGGSEGVQESEPRGGLDRSAHNNARSGHISARGSREGLVRSGHIRGMAVLPDYQGKGAADQLLHAAEAALRAAGCTRVTLDTTAPLQRAIRFYERNGYRATGHVSDFYGMELFEYEKDLGAGG